MVKPEVQELSIFIKTYGIELFKAFIMGYSGPCFGLEYKSKIVVITAFGTVKIFSWQ